MGPKVTKFAALFLLGGTAIMKQDETVSSIHVIFHREKLQGRVGRELKIPPRYRHAYQGH